MVRMEDRKTGQLIEDQKLKKGQAVVCIKAMDVNGEEYAKCNEESKHLSVGF